VEEASARQKALSLEAIVTASPFAEGGLTLPLGSSIGFTMLEPQDTAEEALGRADHAMYGRKSERKRVL
jgi:GGDEF domain-containing protein